jgi:hypothetical protein
MRTLLFCLTSIALLACSGSETAHVASPATTEPAAHATDPGMVVEGETAEVPVAPGAPVITDPATGSPTVDPASTGAAVCGTRGASPCPVGTYCDYVAGSNCGADDRGGRCEPVPEMCTREFMPVCGCDGTTYPTACVAHSAAVSVAHDGPC